MMTGRLGRRLTAVATALILSLSMSAGSLAAGGKALGVNPDASATTEQVTRTLTVGSDLAIGDLVVTGDKGLVQILFDDRTKLVVGPGSRLVLEDYLLRADGSAGRFTVNALAGTFRFATGNAPKDRYLIKTPTGTIGVRGTKFDLNTGEWGARALLFEGGLRLCNLSGTCVDIEGSCQVGSFNLAEALVIGATDGIGGEDRRNLKREFRYAENQSPLMGQFRVENARECLNRPFVGNTQLQEPASEVDSKREPCRNVDNGVCYDNW